MTHWTRFFPLVACLVLAGCDSDPVVLETISDAPLPPTSDVAIVNFCSACHPMPNPTSFVKERWNHEVRQGIDLYRKSQRTDLVIPDFDATLAWFEQYAPDQLSFEKFALPPEEQSSPFQPVRISIDTRGDDSSLVAVSHAFNLARKDEPPHFALADMGSGHLLSATLTDGKLALDSMGQVAHPAHIEATDLDGDGKRDFLVADLGGFFPGPNRRGSLWWFRPRQDGEPPIARTPRAGQTNLRARPDTKQWRRVPLRMGLMRVSDVRAADFDGDEDLDLVVAEFGLHFDGGIHLLTNIGMTDGVPQFESRILDDRPGPIHLPITDLNGDGHPDFIALISQHHETIDAFLNKGDGTFRKETIYNAGDPAYGSSGIELADMDGDGDIDLLMSNGDTFDDEIPKPIHTIQWLENQGKFPYKHHHVGQMPGAYRAVAGDIDLDGDIDVAAVALLVDSSIQPHPPGTFDGVVFFERVAGGKFVRHRLQSDRCDSATCQLIDWDNDGDLDLVTFPFSTMLRSVDSITLFRNDH